jgi:hypothetical protein
LTPPLGILYEFKLMKKSWEQCVVFGILGILIGQLLPRAGDEARDAGEDDLSSDAGRNTKLSQRSESGQGGKQERWRREVSGAQPKQFTDLIYRAMELPDMLDRKMAMFEILKHADASNGEEIMDGFAKVTWETGRTNTDAWRDALVEVGRKAGAPVLEKFKADGCDGGDQKLWIGLYGMASADPHGAMEWLTGASNEDLAMKNRLYSAVVCGTTLASPEEGIRMMAALPAEIKRACLSDFTWNLIQNGGLDRAVDWMLDLRKTSAGSEPQFVEAAENEIFDKIAGSVLERGGTVEMVSFLSRINADTPITTPQMVRTTSRIPPGLRLDFFDQIAQIPAMATSEAVDQALVQTIRQTKKNSPEVVHQWLESHPSSPIALRIRDLLGHPLSNDN